jgi:large subunit ribosomal protein L20
MSRVKRGVIANKRRKNVLAQVKGYRFGRSNKEKLATEAIKHALRNAFRDRRAKKRDFRKLWNVRLNAGLRNLGTTYSKFIHMMTTQEVRLNRKVLSEMAAERPEAFKRVVDHVVSNAK